MANVKELIEQFLQGSLPLEQVLDALDTSPAHGQALNKLLPWLNEQLQAGALSQTQYKTLRSRMPARSAANDVKTVLAPASGSAPSSETPNEADAGIDPTTPSIAPAVDEATRIQPEFAPHVEPTGTGAAPHNDLGSTPAPDDTGTRIAPRGGPLAHEAGTRIATRGGPPPLTTPTTTPVAGRRRGPVTSGSILKDRFVLETMIARGGMGVVYKARDVRKEEAQDRNPYVAIKVLTEDFKHHPDAFMALQRETKKAQDLAHPNIVTVYDFDRDADTVFMTMQLLHGESLDIVIKRQNGAALALPRAMAIIEGMGAGLAYAHKKGIVHSDFKPGNVFLTDDDTVKILDFGIARAAKIPGNKHQDTTVFDAGSLGALTPAYASCEMLEGDEPDARDDVYALACVAYELLSGRHPFGKLQADQARDAKLQPKSVPGLKREQWRALNRGLEFARNARTPSVEQFLQELRGIKRRTSFAWLAPTVAATALVAIAAWIVLLKPPPAIHPQPPPIIVEKQEAKPFESLPKNVQEDVIKFLEIGDAHMAIGRYMEPPGFSAFDAYQRVLELHPHNPNAVNAMESIAGKYELMAEAALSRGENAEALRLAQLGLKAQPNRTSLAHLLRRIESELGTS